MKTAKAIALTVGACVALTACSSSGATPSPTPSPATAASTESVEQKVRQDALTALTLLDPVIRSKHAEVGTAAHRDAPIFLAPSIIKKFQQYGFDSLKKGYISYTSGMERTLVKLESLKEDTAVVLACAVGAKTVAKDRNGKIIPQPTQATPKPPYKVTMNFKKLGENWQMQTYQLDRSETCTSV